MKYLKLISIFIITTLLFTGCDFFRSIAGKPTSMDLERMKREELEKVRQHELDSMAKAQAAIEAEAAEKADSDIIDESAGRFHVIFGSFKVDGNAGQLKALLEKKGYSPKIIHFLNGFDVVSVNAYDNYKKAYYRLIELLELDICPDDIWIYDIHQNLHEK